MKLPLIPLDKANHFIYGFIIYVLSNLFLSDLLSVGTVFCFALGKEVRDQIVYKGFDCKDLVVTITPAAIFFVKKYFEV